MKKTLSVFALFALVLTLMLTLSIGVSASSAEHLQSDEILDEHPPERTEEEIPEQTPDETVPEDSGNTAGGITLDDVSALIKDALAEAGISEKILDWRSYVEKQLIPAAVTAISAIAALYVACIPLIKNIKNSIQNVVENVKSGVGLFKKAADDVSSATEEKQKTETELATLKEDLAYIKSHIKTVEEIERIGFGNLKELVTGGIASEIGKVGHEDENQT